MIDWTGLDWTGLDWTGLDWTAADPDPEPAAGHTFVAIVIGTVTIL